MPFYSHRVIRFTLKNQFDVCGDKNFISHTRQSLYYYIIMYVYVRMKILSR